MNKSWLLFLVLAACPFFMETARADGLVVFPTGDAAWTVEVAPGGSSLYSPKPEVQRVQVTQLNNVKRVVISWDDGKTTEKWTIPKLPVVFEEDPRDGVVSPFQNKTLRDTRINFFMTYDSFAFDWVSSGTLKEKTPVDYGGKRCFHFISSASPPLSNGVYKREAWIDAKTLLPVAYNNGVSLSTYVFAPKPPTGPLDFPPAFRTAINYYKSTMGYQ